MKDEAADLAAWREAYRSRMGAGSSACPGEQELAALATGELPGEARAALADHVVGCAACARTHRLLTELHRAAAGRPRALTRSWTVLASTAAALMVAVGLLVSRPAILGPDRGGEDAVRGESPVARADPLPNAVLGRAPAHLAWKARPDARGYRVRVYDADGDLLWEGSAGRDTRVGLPAAAAERLVPGHAYFWTVEPIGAGPSALLGPYWFRIAPPR